MSKNAVEMFTAFLDNLGKTDDFGSCSDDYKQSEFAVIFKLNIKFHIIHLMN